MDLMHWAQQFIVPIHNVSTPDYYEIGRTFWLGLIAVIVGVGVYSALKEGE